jgi:predicted alpha/beta-hydrolase family hydrolase
MPADVSQFADPATDPPVRGSLHLPDNPNGDGLILTHGAGSDSRAKLIVAVAEAFCGAGLTVLRCDLPFRQNRPTGPPFPATAARDREGLRRAVEVMRQKIAGRVFLGGHSYGGRQATMLAAEEPELVAGLLLLSYPLHPPRKPAELRTAHFPKLRTPAIFVQGSRDPFGLPAEIELALKLIPGRHSLTMMEGAGHDLLGRKYGVPELIVQTFTGFFGQAMVS